ncbi:MAG TPA: DUF5522 domain-containing protein [Acidimicrobiales bacterium]|nr:DUF5522 domain-containing protein [Acidimicrobiales bacterium]
MAAPTHVTTVISPSGGRLPPGSPHSSYARWVPANDGHWAPRARPEPHASRLSPDSPGYAAVVRAHVEALAAGDAGYLDPGTGLFVFTAATLASRPCCGSGCRHCPWIDPPCGGDGG